MTNDNLSRVFLLDELDAGNPNVLAELAEPLDISIMHCCANSDCRSSSVTAPNNNEDTTMITLTDGQTRRTKLKAQWEQGWVSDAEFFTA